MPSAQQSSFSDRTISDKRDTRKGEAAFPPRPEVRGFHAAILMSGQPANWARNVVFGAKDLRAPSSVTELQEIVRGGDQVRALGSGHSFNRIADTTGVLVSTSSLPPVIEILPGGSTVKVAGGVRYGELAQQLDRARLRAAQSRIPAAYFGRRGVCHRNARLRGRQPEPGRVRDRTGDGHRRR